MEQIHSPPFILQKNDREEIELLKETGELISRFQDVVMGRVFDCMQLRPVKQMDFNCHTFVEHVVNKAKLGFYPPSIAGEPMDMLDARREFGLPYGINFEKKFGENLAINHSALVVGWDGTEPILVDKWSGRRIKVRHMRESRNYYKPERVRCYRALPHP